MLAAFLTTILFSISAVSANRTAKMMGGTAANFYRLVLATVLLGLYAHLRSTGLHGKAFPILFISGCVGFGLGDLALFQALPRLGSRLTVMVVHCLAAPLAASIEWIWLGTRLSPLEIVVALTILTGVGLGLAPERRASVPVPHFFSGVVFAVLAALGQGLGAVLSRKAYEVAHLAGQNIDGITAAYQRIIGGVLVCGIWFWAVYRRDRLGAAKGSLVHSPFVTGGTRSRAWFWVVINSLAGPTLGVSCYQWALESTPTGLVLPIVAVTPLVVIPFARYMEGERPAPRSLLGGAIAVGGAVILAIVR